MPMYEYLCPYCGYRKDVFMSYKQLDNVHIFCDRDYCRIVEVTNENPHGKIEMKRLISKSQSKPIVIDYFSKNAQAYFTGPKQRERILKEKNLACTG